MSIVFEGGPANGDELHPLAARLLAGEQPPFVCYSVDGRYEHYERHQGDVYVHVGACHTMALSEEGHAPCGHDHTSDW